MSGTITWDAVLARRLRRQFLAGPGAAGAVEAVRAVGAIHAQMMPAAEVSIGIRGASLTAADVRRELWGRRRLVHSRAV